ncbi:DUF3887 domain-containing protein [Ornithinibacillus halotolerans]|uniref:DUF3887 domain-containing protein n=1 Tax=Ornithinibacillus halotolerans TaxID=1274357 RepID=A0A916SAV9_9BACI|nr:DUF3887 domain-containing protein [Ornithinibacillus halotolerans]GGA91111.1 hypothetical protein GCM10008025_37040 [Ornithinibacillus halotolerans]
MKKLILPMFIIALMLVLVACGSDDSDPNTEKYSEKAEEVVSLLNEHKYEEVHAMFDETMEQGLSLENMNQFTPVLEESGDFVAFEKTSVDEQDGLYVTVVIAKYSNLNRVYTISFNDKDEIAGLFIK